MGGKETITKSEQNIVLTFKNDSAKELSIIVDPPCEEFRVSIGSIFKLTIFNYRSSNADISEIVDFRYETERINIDVNYNLELGVEIDGHFRIVWKIS